MDKVTYRHWHRMSPKWSNGMNIGRMCAVIMVLTIHGTVWADDMIIDHATTFALILRPV